VRDLKLFSMFSIPHRNQIYTMYRGILHEGKASAGEETLETAMVCEQDIPWQEMAFPVVIENLKLYFEDRKKGVFKTHYGEIVQQENGELKVTMIS